MMEVDTVVKAALSFARKRFYFYNFYRKLYFASVLTLSACFKQRLGGQNAETAIIFSIYLKLLS